MFSIFCFTSKLLGTHRRFIFYAKNSHRDEKIPQLYFNRSVIQGIFQREFSLSKATGSFSFTFKTRQHSKLKSCTKDVGDLGKNLVRFSRSNEDCVDHRAWRMDYENCSCPSPERYHLCRHLHPCPPASSSSVSTSLGHFGTRPKRQRTPEIYKLRLSRISTSIEFWPEAPSSAVQFSGTAAWGPWRPDCDWWQSRISWCAIGGAWTMYASSSSAKMHSGHPDLLGRNSSPSIPNWDLQLKNDYLSLVSLILFSSFNSLTSIYLS